MSDSELELNRIENVIAQNGEIMTCSSGFSMYPMLRNRKDMVVVVKPESRPKRHDVVLYRTGKKVLLHRIIKDLGDEYIIRGDNRLNKEYGITPDDIFGILKGFYRNGKYIDCKTNKLYKAYIIFNRTSYPLRFLWKKFRDNILRRGLSKIKRTLFKKK